jgi:hypothetical protein
MFTSVIHKNVKLAESPSHGKPISGYDRNSRGCKDYMALAREVIEHEAGGQRAGAENVGQPTATENVEHPTSNVEH